MENFKKKYGPWALISGASSGLGAEYARQLAPKGMNLILVARRKDRLDTLAKELSEEYSIDTRTIQADLTSPDFIEKITPVTDGLEVGLLINNAGFATTGHFLELPLEGELDLLHLNCRAPLILTHHFGNLMKTRNRGGIIIVASLVAFIAAPNWVGYSTSKVWDLYFGHALWGELRGTGIDVQALCPGATHTEFGKVAGTRSRGGSMPAPPVIAESLRKFGKKPFVIAGTKNKFLYSLTRLLPRSMMTVVFGKMLDKLKSQ
ncbi:SDR family NAD(P)-dependent oxidoreductase [candidate division KSB1 bacterium]